MSTQNATRRPQILRLPHLRPEYGLAPSTIWKQIKLGLWPTPIKLTAKASGWIAGECDQVLAARVRGESDEAIKALVIKLEAARQAASIAAA